LLYIHIVEIPTKKRANSYTLKLLKIGNYYMKVKLYGFSKKIDKQ